MRHGWRWPESVSPRTATTKGSCEVNKVLAAEPKNAEAWHTKGKILMAKEDYKGAAEATARSLELHRDANAQLLLALAYLNLKEKPKAEAVFRQMTQDYGDRAIWHVIIGGAYRETGYQSEAVEEFRKAIAMDNTVPHVHYFLGLTLMEINNNGTTPEIMHEYQEEVRQFPDDFFGNYGLGGLESRDGDVEQSNKHLLAASKADPNNPDPYMYLGLNALKQRDNATAETYLRKAITSYRRQRVAQRLQHPPRIHRAGAHSGKRRQERRGPGLLRQGQSAERFGASCE